MEINMIQLLSPDDGSELLLLYGVETVWACGGIGGLYEHSTNFPHLTGDALGISLKHNIHLQNIDYIQIHPTTLYSKKSGRSFLISESVRGEGGILLNKAGERFTDELKPRDVVSSAILKQMKEDEMPYVRLSMEAIPKEVIKNHFCHIYERCLEEGYDCTKEPIPVVPAQHYFMGGVSVDENSATSLHRLYAVGETSCNGVHGANRLASNSLLESLVFAKRSAEAITLQLKKDTLAGKEKMRIKSRIDVSEYAEASVLQETYKETIIKEIERMKKYHECNHNEVKCG